MILIDGYEMPITVRGGNILASGTLIGGKIFVGEKEQTLIRGAIGTTLIHLAFKV